MNRAIVFFIRHYNDLDHMVPVIYKIALYQNPPYLFVIFLKRLEVDDFRIQILRDLNSIKIHHIDDFNLYNTGYLKKFYRAACRQPIIRKILSIRHNTNKINTRAEYIEQIFNSLLKDSLDVVICFDWVMETSKAVLEFSRNVVHVAKKRAYKTVALPHGDSPHWNKMIFKKDLNYETADIFSPTAMFDYVVVPNELCANRYRPHMNEKQIKVLGSPRFNDEWLGVLEKNIPTYQNTRAQKMTKIVFFLRPNQFIVFFEEVLHTIRLISQFKNVFLVIVHHSRVLTKELSKLDDKDIIINLSNIEIVTGEVQPSSLIQWADLILDLSTSITFEAVKYGKPILSMENLHGNLSTIAHYMPDTKISCRDDLYNAIERFISDPEILFYSTEEKQNFINSMIDVPNKDVLTRYADFLLDISKS